MFSLVLTEPYQREFCTQPPRTRVFKKKKKNRQQNTTVDKEELQNTLNLSQTPAFVLLLCVQSCGCLWWLFFSGMAWHLISPSVLACVHFIFHRLLHNTDGCKKKVISSASLICDIHIVKAWWYCLWQTVFEWVHSCTSICQWDFLLFWPMAAYWFRLHLENSFFVEKNSNKWLVFILLAHLRMWLFMVKNIKVVSWPCIVTNHNVAFFQCGLASVKFLV